MSKLFLWYWDWQLDAHVAKCPLELLLRRPTLHRLLTLCSVHGDFWWYNEHFHHKDTNLWCTCGGSKSLEHLILCQKTKRLFQTWP